MLLLQVVLQVALLAVVRSSRPLEGAVAREPAGLLGRGATASATGWAGLGGATGSGRVTW